MVGSEKVALRQRVSDLYAGMIIAACDGDLDKARKMLPELEASGDAGSLAWWMEVENKVPLGTPRKNIAGQTELLWNLGVRP